MGLTPFFLGRNNYFVDLPAALVSLRRELHGIPSKFLIHGDAFSYNSEETYRNDRAPRTSKVQVRVKTMKSTSG